MIDDPTDTRARRRADDRPKSEELARTPRDTVDGTVTPQDGPGTQAGESADEPVSGEPVGVSGDDPGVGLSGSSEPDIDGSRGM